MKEPENNGPKASVRLTEHVRMLLPGDHPANRRGMPDCPDEACRRVQG
jgi:hypothetical protein